MALHVRLQLVYFTDPNTSSQTLVTYTNLSTDPGLGTTKIYYQDKNGNQIVHKRREQVFNNNGSIRGVVVTNQDITFRKQAEQNLIQISKKLEIRVVERTAELSKMNAELQLAEEKYRTVADHTYGWEYWTDQNENFIYCVVKFD